MTGSPARPELEPLARFRVALDPILDLGATPWGNRRIIPIIDDRYAWLGRTIGIVGRANRRRGRVRRIHAHLNAAIRQ
ncbi:hypothetical protein [Yinghuangia sp. YIM S10712]|uniref:hypothetical protein n=1 Tax=Yinghuangia sp. YIM S10712 TaxID=3436930 RepID=UPI003F539547